MDLNRYLKEVGVGDLPKLKRFAFVGRPGDFDGKLNYLIKIAEQEKWDQTDVHTGRKNSTIFYYIIHTFDRCFTQNKISIEKDETVAFFNTGLMTPQGQEIYGEFEKSNFYDESNPSSNYWYFKSFVKANERSFMENCSVPPQTATYFNDFNELYFDPNLDIEMHFDHIYDDNHDRLPNELTSLDKDTANQVFEGFLNFTKKKIKRNNRIPVPQFYNEKIMFLIPVKVFGTKTVVIALEKLNNKYVANTVLTIGMAYNCARLLNKPESEWLLNIE